MSKPEPRELSAERLGPEQLADHLINTLPDWASGHIRKLWFHISHLEDGIAYLNAEAKEFQQKLTAAEQDRDRLREALGSFKVWADKWCDSAGTAAAFKATEQYREMEAALANPETPAPSLEEKPE